MEKILQQYIKATGAKGATLLTVSEKYGEVYDLQYGGEGDDGLLLPTGLPVLVYVKDGKVTVLPEKEAFALLSLLDDAA